MNLAASLSSIATIHFANCQRCFRSLKTQISSPSLRIMSQFSLSASAAYARPMSSDTAAVAAKKQPKQPWLIVGLGNPGEKYNTTRHNVGFAMVDAIAEAEGISLSSVSFKALVGKGLIGDVPVIFAKPQTFINESGESVGSIVSDYKIPKKQVLVIFDDLDLPFAKLRLLPKGGHGGHNGMRSVIDHFEGSCDFPRLRIGIGRPPGTKEQHHCYHYYLEEGRFTEQEREALNFTFQDGLEAVRTLLLEGFNKSAKFVNSAKPSKQCG